MIRVGELARSTTYLEPDDPVGKAAEHLRQSPFAALPVVQDGHVIGMVFEEDVFDIVCHGNGERGWSIIMDDASTMRVRDIMRTGMLSIPDVLTIADAAQLFATAGLPVLPVVDDQGRLRGLISRADVASALCHALRPTRVAGMSTPLGVYLTSGAHRGGAGDFGLFLTGAAMAALLFVAQFMVKVVFHIVDVTTGLNLLSLYQDASELMLQSDLAMSVSALGMLLQVIFFFALMRILPLAGYHGAEHKVVHAIERGEMLTAERVLSMPRVHPRCGTNIVAMILLFLTIYFGRPSMWLTIILVGVVMLTWRRLGMLLQALFTTKNPTPKQLESALRAGRELLARYQEHPNYRPPFIVAIWNMGFIQAFAGFGTLYLIGMLCSWIIDRFIVV